MSESALDRHGPGPILRGMERSGAGPDREDFGEASLGDTQWSDPPDDPMIEPDADPLDTDVEDADLFLGLDDDEEQDDD